MRHEMLRQMLHGYSVCQSKVLTASMASCCAKSAIQRATLLLRNQVLALLQTLHLEVLARRTAVDVLHVICHGLKVAAGIVAPAQEDVVVLAGLQGLIDGDRGAHEFLLDLPEAVKARLDFEVVVGRGLGDRADNSDVVPLRADVVGGRDDRDVYVCAIGGQSLQNALSPLLAYRVSGQPGSGE